MAPPPPDLPDAPDLALERALGGCVCGIDEVGYAPLAGPVMAAAVVLPDGPPPPRLHGLTDSKLLSRRTRERLHDAILDLAAVGIGTASVAEIDALNVLRANLLAMGRAVAALGVTPDAALVDGRHAPSLECAVHTVVKGDRRSLSIAAASVVAKVTRDRLMAGLDAAHPGYGWARNAGYGTEEHYLGLLRLGITPHHRRSFAPIGTLFAQGGEAQGYRFAPVAGAPRAAGLEILALRQDLSAVFDEAGHHLGVLKCVRGNWRVRATGYDGAGAPTEGAGPLAPWHGRSLAGGDALALGRLIAGG